MHINYFYQYVKVNISVNNTFYNEVMNIIVLYNKCTNPTIQSTKFHVSFKPKSEMDLFYRN